MRKAHAGTTPLSQFFLREELIMTQLNTGPARFIDDTVGAGPLAPPAAIAVLDRVLGVRPATVVDVRPETPTLVSVRLERPAGFAYRAGQFALLRLATIAGPDLRPFSLASTPHEGDLRFVTRRGPSLYKQALLALQPGDKVKVSRAMGSFHLDPDRPAVLVSAGIGAAPMRSMVSTAASSGYEAPLRLLFSNRTADEIPFRDELERLAWVHSNLQLTWVVTSETGRITDEQLRRQSDDLPDAVFYVTGPAPFVRGVVQMLRGIGLSRSRIRLSKQTVPFPNQRRS
jgi:ferredoxin-NADP reductase